MAVYFCDSSALVKRHVTEPGSAWLISATNPAAGNHVFVAGITGAEVVAALTRKQRGGHLSITDAAVAIGRFRHDYANELRIVAASPMIITYAMALAEKHGLRGYDAVQLAAALLTERRRRARKLSAITFLSADDDLNAAAAAEGLTTDNPNTH